MIGTISFSTVTVEEAALVPRPPPPRDGSNAATLPPSAVTVARAVAIRLNVKVVSERSKADEKPEDTGSGQSTARAADRDGKQAKANDHRAAEITRAEQAQVRQLQARDRAVRAHEQAHMAAGAGITGAPTYTYQTGPDGRRYAVGGEVAIRTNPSSSDPEAAIRQLKQVVRAALAPATPSSQDRAVAAAAQAKIASLQAKTLRERRVEVEEEIEPPRQDGEVEPSNLESSRALLAYRKADQTRPFGPDSVSSGSLLSLTA